MTPELQRALAAAALEFVESYELSLEPVSEEGLIPLAERWQESVHEMLAVVSQNRDAVRAAAQPEYDIPEDAPKDPYLWESGT